MAKCIICNSPGRPVKEGYICRNHRDRRLSEGFYRVRNNLLEGPFMKEADQFDPAGAEREESEAEAQKDAVSSGTTPPKFRKNRSSPDTVAQVKPNPPAKADPEAERHARAAGMVGAAQAAGFTPNGTPKPAAPGAFQHRTNTQSSTSTPPASATSGPPQMRQQYRINRADGQEIKQSTSAPPGPAMQGPMRPGVAKAVDNVKAQADKFNPPPLPPGGPGKDAKMAPAPTGKSSKEKLSGLKSLYGKKDGGTAPPAATPAPAASAKAPAASSAAPETDPLDGDYPPDTDRAFPFGDSGPGRGGDWHGWGPGGQKSSGGQTGSGVNQTSPISGGAGGTGDIDDATLQSIIQDVQSASQSLSKKEIDPAFKSLDKAYNALKGKTSSRSSAGGGSGIVDKIKGGVAGAIKGFQGQK